MSRKRVAYYYDRAFNPDLWHNSLVYSQANADDIGSYGYGLGHPMKPQRMKMTHELVSAYDMVNKMQILVCTPPFLDYNAIFNVI
jgi:histone deacetylase 1/2